MSSSNVASVFTSAQSGREIVFLSCTYVVFHVEVKEIRWDYVEPEAKQHGKGI
jgi:hypothetical protein